MKKIILFWAIFLTFSQINLKTLALEELEDVGIAKYAVLETTVANIPLREKDNENSKRISHLFERTVLFAVKQNKHYYKVELNENNFAWINKNNVEVQAVIPEKRFDDIVQIKNKTKKEKHILEIKTESKSPFRFIENGSNLSFVMYDVHFDPLNIKNSDKINHFIFSDKIENELKIDYLSNRPLFGYELNKNEDGYLLVVKKAPKVDSKKPLKDIVITLDAGHGGCECGVCAHNLKEKDVNLQITKKLKKELQKKGAKVYLTRKRDKKVALYERCDFAREKNSDILLSIHQNSLPNPKNVDKKHGVGTYYYHNQSKPLAQSILDNLVENTNFRNDGVNFASFALTRPTSQISVLVECGYLIKEDEALKLKDKKFQKIIAKSITKGCEEYLKNSFNWFCL